MTQPSPDDLLALRKRVEERLKRDAAPLDGPGEQSPLSWTTHELQVHQIELELQNEELRSARAEEDRLRGMYADFYDFSPVGFASLAPGGEILQVNLMGARLLGRDRARVAGERFGIFLDWLDRPVFDAFLARLFEEGGRHSCDVKLAGPGQELRIVHIEGVPTEDRQECRTVLVDVTEQHRASEERRFLERELMQSQKLESLGSLAGGVAHDMNNVLGAILGLASTMRQTAEPASVDAKSLDTIISACTRGREVVKGLLYFAHKELREERPLDLNLLATEMVQLLGSTTLKRIKLELDLQCDLASVRGDAGALNNALMNLCVNALDAMTQGGTLRIETRRQEDGSVELRVKDTGEGMSEETLAKAIDPFFTTKPAGKGTGLGLSMVYATMKAHEGRLEIHSQIGVGTEVVLSFPACRAMSAATLRKGVTLKVGSDVRTMDILLVDDDEDIREALAAMLQALGHRVLPAPSGQEALRLLETGVSVDLAFLDMNMPDMNGSQALPQILALRPGLAVIINTGYSDQDVLPLLAGHPNVKSILKPFTLQELKAKLDDVQRCKAHRDS